MQSIGELVRKQESEWRSGTVTKSRYVHFNMKDRIDTIDAYLNSKHTSGETDSLGRDKPFFNIVVAQRNIWMRATDLDTKDVQFRADTSKEWLNVLLAKIFVRDWMRRERFATFLNTWGRQLAGYGSAPVKIIENNSGLHISVPSWQRHMCDPVEYGPNPKIDVLELTEGQLRRRVQTNGYNKDVVAALCAAKQDRQTQDGTPVDNRPDYIRLYEVHALLSRAVLLQAQGKPYLPADEDVFVQQMHVLSYVGKKMSSGRTSKKEYDDFCVYSGQEAEDPYLISHLIEEEGQTLAIGPVENSFQAQWMENHTAKTAKDTLDLCSKLVWQTADPMFVGQNVLDNIESGDILLHVMNMPLTKVDTSKPDIQLVSNFGEQWHALSREINGISEIMLGRMPAHGTSSSLIAMLLKEGHAMFEMMTENKGLHLVEMFRTRILPYIKRVKLNHSKEIGAVLEDNDVARVDAIFLKNEAIKRTNAHVLTAINDNLDNIKAGKPVQPIDVQGMLQQNTAALQASTALMGNQRFFKPSEITDLMWADQLKDFEWNMEVNITGEEADGMEIAAGLSQALAIVSQPGYDQNPEAQLIVRKMLSLSGILSPIEVASAAQSQRPALQPVAPTAPTAPAAPPPSSLPAPAMQ